MAVQGSPSRPRPFRLGLFLLIALVWSSVGPTPPVRATGWLWPLDLPDRQLTGTFMEARSGRFHSGLDLRTQGRVGVPVRAPVAGRVVRLRVSAEGYGKALYLRASDGRTAVFAHLFEFADRLRPPLIEAQMRSGVYAQDLYLREGGIPVRAGEILALSGATGVGAPHLHFEVRDARSRPVNPLALYDLPDRRPPEIEGLRLRPLGPDARVEGEATSRPAIEGDSLRVWGRIGVSARVRDRRPGNDFSLMPHVVQLRRDGARVYELRQERFAFSTSGQMELEFEPDPGGGRRWLRLYRRPGNELGGREGPAFEGLLADDDQWHEITVVARDYSGNEHRRTFHLRWEEEPAIPPGRETPDSLDLELEETHMALLAEGTTAPPWLALDSSPDRPIQGWTRAGAGRWSTALAWSDLPEGSWRLIGPDGSERSEQQSLLPGGRAARLHWSENSGRLSVAASADAAFAGGALRLEPMVPTRGPDCRPLAERSWQVLRRGFVARGPIRVHWESDGVLPEGAGWVLVDGDEPTWLEARRGQDERELWAEELDEGELRLVVDDIEPRIGLPRSQGRRLRDGLRPRDEEQRLAAPGLHRPRWPSVDVPVIDACSGLEESGVGGELDGRPWPVRYDPEQKTVSFDFHVDPGVGEHRLVLHVQDRAGNRSRASWVVPFRNSDAGP